MQYEAEATAIVEVCRRLHARGLLAGAEGNVSVRVSNDSMLITPAGADKGGLQPQQLVVQPLVGSTDYHKHATDAGEVPVSRDKAGRPSSEIEMHRACYAHRPDVHAVVHAHPPVATGLATAGRPLPANIVPELPAVVGPVALVPYGRPGTPALSSAMLPLLHRHEVFLLANHGVTAVGKTLDEALQRMESTEQAARIFVVAELMGGAVPLAQTEADALLALHPRAAAHLHSNRNP